MDLFACEAQGGGVWKDVKRCVCGPGESGSMHRVQARDLVASLFIFRTFVVMIKIRCRVDYWGNF